MTTLVQQPLADVTREEAPDDTPQEGQWYWIKGGRRKEPRWLGCVTHVGSNYAELEGKDDQQRIHFDKFHKLCELESDPTPYIQGKINAHQQEVRQLLAEVKAVTMRLGVGPQATLDAGSTIAAITIGNTTPVEQYGKALALAKEETLPELFAKIQASNRQLAEWLGVQTIPYKAKSGALKELTESIENRIFAVELYAGLCEQTTQIADGVPAAPGEKIHLFQRRAYMDEECLAAYETGGMDFESLEEFDEWIARPVNRDRILPFPRSVISFQVRRNAKERHFESIREFINFAFGGLADADRLTFLYLRNGERLYRLNTRIEFGEQLFPDSEHSKLAGKIWGYTETHREEDFHFVGEHLYADMIREREEGEARKKADPTKSWKVDVPHERKTFHPFDRTSVYYDDMRNKLQREIETHNRIALVLQGILDRSLVFHPHPPWRLNTPEGFFSALDLVFDQSRTLTTGDAPDFEAYRVKCNAQLKPGCVTVGQQFLWERAMADREMERQRDRYGHVKHEFHTYKPQGNPGPGRVARVVSMRGGKARFEWTRVREFSWRTERETEVHPDSFSVDAGLLFNVDAYRKGDFHLFFDDPRTRATYLEWAPLLLIAEEYQAGNRPLPEFKPVHVPPRVRTWEQEQKLERARELKAIQKKFPRGTLVRFTSEHTTQGGTKFKTTDRLKVSSCHRGKFGIWRIYPMDLKNNHIINIDPRDFVLDTRPPVPLPKDLPTHDVKKRDYTCSCPCKPCRAAPCHRGLCAKKPEKE